MIHHDRFAPQSLDEALSLLSKYGKEACVIAGGTDLIIRQKKEKMTSGYYVVIDSLQDLNYIEERDDELRIGAVTRIHDLVVSSVIENRYPMLHQAAKWLGTPTIRRRATIGGNLCNAAPSADTAPPLLVMDARLFILGPGGERSISIEDFFLGPGLTSLAPDEILTEIRIPALDAEWKGNYLKMTRSNGADLASVGVATLLKQASSTIETVRIALGAVAPVPIRARKAEKRLEGNPPAEDILEKCAQAAVSESIPIDDIRASAVYRKTLIGVLVKRSITQAVGRD